MTAVDERLAVRKSRAHVRFVEDLTLALKETEPSKADLEQALQDQVLQGRRLLEMGEAACHLASVARLQPDTHKQMEWALTVGGKAFRDLQEMVAHWTRRHGVSLESEQDLAPLVAAMDRCRTELALGSQEGQRDTGADRPAFPQVGTTEWGQMNQRRAELIRKHLRGDLSEDERQEYETLQRLSLAVVEASFPQQGKVAAPEGPSEARGE